MTGTVIVADLLVVQEQVGLTLQIKMADNQQPVLKVTVSTLISTVKLWEGLKEALLLEFVGIRLWIKQMNNN